MTDDERRELAELYAADDRLRAEHADWLARREAAAAAPVRKSNAEGVLYRTSENNAQAPAVAAVVSAPSDETDWRDEVAQSMGEIFAHERKRERSERNAALAVLNREISVLKNENAEIRGMLGAVLAIIGGDKKVGQKGHDDSVVELPKNFLRRVVHNNG
jgi:hypothetical protein